MKKNNIITISTAVIVVVIIVFAIIYNASHNDITNITFESTTHSTTNADISKNSSVKDETTIVSESNSKEAVTKNSTTSNATEKASDVITTEATTTKPVTTTESTTTERQPVYTDENETVYATDTVKVRTGPDTSYSSVGTLTKNESVKRTAIGDNGWSKISYDDGTYYVYSEYLTTKKPVVTTTTKPTTTAPTTTKPVTEESTTKKPTTTPVTEIRIETTTEKDLISTIDTSFNDNEFAKELFKLVNDYRVKNGLHKLTYNNDLEAIACVRAKEIEDKWSHTRPNGNPYSTVYTEYKYRATFVGENLAKSTADAEAIVQAWIDSPSHNENLVHTDFTKIGMAVYRSNDGNVYIAQEFSN